MEHLRMIDPGRESQAPPTPRRTLPTKPSRTMTTGANVLTSMARTLDLRVGRIRRAIGTDLLDLGGQPVDQRGQKR